MTTADLGHKQQTDQMDRQLVAGRYRLLSRIGRGQLGEIYEADDEGHHNLGVERRVAIQLLPDSVTQNHGLFNKLRVGYTVLRAAPHPNIVPILDFDHDGRFGYLVTDLLEGASLRLVLDSDVQDNDEALPLDEAIPVIRAVGDALQFLHTKSMVHGRLTAESVFITENLEVRLVDVVPLDSATTLLRGVASKDRFSRCNFAEDIYGLACLAYEMLVGKHPFNFHALAEARQAGLKPTPIDSLPEKQWNALCHALSFDREQQTPSIADFLREFGIKGTERLQPSDDATAKCDSSSSLPVNGVPQPTHSAGSSSSTPSSAPVTPATWTDPVAQPIDEFYVEPAKSKPAKWVPSPILVMAVVGLGAWLFYGQPRDDVARLIEYVASYLDGKSAGSGDGGLPIVESDLAQAASADAGSEVILPATATQPVVEDDAPAETEDASLVTGDDANSELTAGTTNEVASEPAEEQSADSTTDASRSNDDAATAELAGTSDIDSSSRSEPEFTLIQSVVYVSERDGAARIATRHPGSKAGPVFWWTGDNTAIAEEDYIPIEQPVEANAVGEWAETLHVPLVNDSLPEPRENFFVYLGQYNAQLGRLEPISRVRVEINDDDR